MFSPFSPRSVGFVSTRRVEPFAAAADRGDVFAFGHAASLGNGHDPYANQFGLALFSPPS